MLKAYQKFILRTNPSILWKVIRYILHIITIPLKLFTIGFNSLLMVVFHLNFLKKRVVPNESSDEDRKFILNYVYKQLPIYENEEIQLYTNRVPVNIQPDGENHNPDHQCSRQGTYSFLMNTVDKGNDKIIHALKRHLWKHVLLRGYKQDGSYNVDTVSGDMLIGLSLGMLNLPKDSDMSSEIRDSFDELLHGIIENDYALTEQRDLGPIEDPIESELWNEELKKVGMRPEKVRIKSSRAMFQPGLETVGAQAITLLSALKIGDKIVGSSYAKKEYKKLIWYYGYGLLSLFPTTFIPSKRAYFNDHNCIVAAYILAKLATNKVSQWYWTLVVKYVWRLSKPYYNPYFTGLMLDLDPDSISNEYHKECLSYLYEELPKVNSEYGTLRKPLEYPVKYNDQERDEFYVDTAPGIVDTIQGKYRSGLGFLAGAIMLEPEKAKEWLK